MTPDERSTDQKLDDLSLNLDRVLGIVQDHGVALADLKTDLGALRVDVQHVRADMSGLRLAMDRLNEHVMGHLNWHVGQQSGDPGPGS
jgi:hypothetical protein